MGHEVGTLQSCGQYRREQGPPSFTPIITHHIIQQPDRGQNVRQAETASRGRVWKVHGETKIKVLYSFYINFRKSYWNSLTGIFTLGKCEVSSDSDNDCTCRQYLKKYHGNGV